ncbi:MAG: hypothetical protein NTY03_00305 [Candidatus Bathyarchaeota archaeon]|nr:hypothetical protein [Candidatus Bathyarchaeota archaeon]
MKKALPILIIASMMLSLIPVVDALPVPLLNPANGMKGTTIKVTGPDGSVTAGATVELYWDDWRHLWDGVEGLLNVTTAKASGAYEVRFKVPDATTGTHTVYVKESSNLAWATFTVTRPRDVGLYTSMALDSEGHPHISYYDATNGDLKYAEWTGSVWSIQKVASIGYADDMYSSIVIDSMGPSISFYDAINGDLKYAHWTGSTWDIQTADSAGNVGMYSSIALDSSGHPCISYFDATNRNLKYAKRIGLTWNVETVDSKVNTGRYTSIAINSMDQSCISYCDWAGYSLNVAQGTVSTWDIQVVEITGIPISFTSIALDSGNSPHIGYFDPTGSDLKYAYRTGSTWSTQTVDSTGDVGAFTSIGLDSSGYPCISYYDGWPYPGGNMNLKYAHWTGSTWDFQTIDSIGNVGKFTSIAIDSGGPSICYYDETNGDLKYAHGTGSTWSLTTIDSGTAQISSSLNEGVPGTAVTISGKGFTPVAGTNVDIFFGTQQVGSIQTLVDGTFSKSVPVPNIGVGPVNIVARDTSGIEASTPFTITGGVTTTTTWYTVPEKAPISTQVTIKGYHFTPGGSWKAVIGVNTVFTGQVPASGEVLGSFPAPSIKGAYTLEVTDLTTSHKSTRTLEVTDPVAPPPTNQATYAGSTDNQYPSNIELTLENLWPYPVQSALYPDIKADKTIDLVISKDTTIVVDVSGVVGVNWPLTINFNGVSIPLTVPNPNGMLFFKGFPILSAPEGVRHIVLSDSVGVLTTVDANAYLTQDLQVTYVNLSAQEFQLTMDSSNKILESTYPVTKSNKYNVAKNMDSNTGDAGVMADCQLAEAQAALQAVNKEGYVVGVAIAPPDYFIKHYPNDPNADRMAGIFWNPDTKGVVVLDGYYSGAAHEIGHTLGLYVSSYEEYEIPEVVSRDEPGYRATGVSVIDNYVIDSWDIMGAGPLGKPYDSWVMTSTYEDLTRALRSTTADPDLILVSGILHKDGAGTVTYIDSSIPWYRFTGTPHTTTPGSYSVKFMGVNGVILETSFTGWFGKWIEPTEDVAPGTPGFGFVESDYSPFCFLAEYPAGTTEILVMDNTVPESPKILNRVYPSELVAYPMADAGGSYVSFTNVATTFDASDSTGKDLTYRWDFNGDGEFDTVWLDTPTTTHMYDVEWSGVAVLEITDGHLTQSSEAQVTIYQQPINTIITAPTVPLSVGAVVNVYAEFVNYIQGSRINDVLISFIKPLQSSGYTAKIEWGDGSLTPGDVTLEGDLIIVSGTHTYLSAGIHTATISLIYNEIIAATSSTEYIVIYNPSKGSVTGAGYYNSPAGAYTSDLKLTGKAAFLILAKYNKGASKPSGETDIVLGARKLLFHSSSYSWLVVFGNKATYRGAGTLNLKPGYEFLLTVTDGGVKGIDKIRIKIWEKATSYVIYDTQRGVPDTADPSIKAYGSVVVLK